MMTVWVELVVGSPERPVGLGIALRDGGDARVQFCGLLRRDGRENEKRAGDQASAAIWHTSVVPDFDHTADQQRCHSL